METNQNGNQKHEIVLSARKKLVMNGVCDVLSFDEYTVRLETVCGELEICGENLKVSSLDTNKGDIVLDGDIESVIYYDKAKSEHKGFFGRLKS